MAEKTLKVNRLKGARRKTHRVAMLAYNNAQTLDITGPLEVFDHASQSLALQEPDAPPAYEISM